MRIITIIVFIVMMAENTAYCFDRGSLKNNLRNPVIFGQETAERPESALSELSKRSIIWHFPDGFSEPENINFYYNLSRKGTKVIIEWYDDEGRDHYTIGMIRYNPFPEKSGGEGFAVYSENQLVPIPISRIRCILGSGISDLQLEPSGLVKMLREETREEKLLGLVLEIRILGETAKETKARLIELLKDKRYSDKLKEQALYALRDACGYNAVPDDLLLELDAMPDDLLLELFENARSDDLRFAVMSLPKMVLLSAGSHKQRFEKALEAYIFNSSKKEPIDNKNIRTLWMPGEEAILSERMPALLQILNDKGSLARFLNVLSMLRDLCPYILFTNVPKGPIYFGKANRLEFNIRELKIAPISESFRRLIIYTEWNEPDSEQEDAIYGKDSISQEELVLIMRWEELGLPVTVAYRDTKGVVSHHTGTIEGVISERKIKISFSDLTFGVDWNDIVSISAHKRLAIELKIPGQAFDRDIIWPEHFLLARKLFKYMHGSGVVKPIFYKTIKGDFYMYGRRLKFDKDPLGIACFKYEEGKRLVNVTNGGPIFDILAKDRVSKSMSALFEMYFTKLAILNIRDINEFVLQIAADALTASVCIHHLGYCVSSKEQNDMHPENIRLQVDGKGVLVADFGAARYLGKRLSMDLRKTETLTLIGGDIGKLDDKIFMGILLQIFERLSMYEATPYMRAKLIEEAIYELGAEKRLKSLRGLLGEIINTKGKSAPVTSDEFNAKVLRLILNPSQPEDLFDRSFFNATKIVRGNL